MSVECYDALAEAYAARAEQSRVSIRATLNEYLLPLMPRYAKFLDIGCAVGVATEEVARAGHDALGIDNSPEMIRIAKRDRKAGKFSVKDFTQEKWWNCDAMLAFAFVHLFPKASAPAVLNRMYIGLKPGGYLYTGTTVEEKSREGWEHKIDYKVDTEVPKDFPPRYRARYLPEEYERLVLNVGFHPVLFNEHEDEFGKLWRDVLVMRPV